MILRIRYFPSCFGVCVSVTPLHPSHFLWLRCASSLAHSLGRSPARWLAGLLGPYARSRLLGPFLRVHWAAWGRAGIVDYLYTYSALLSEAISVGNRGVTAGSALRGALNTCPTPAQLGDMQVCVSTMTAAAQSQERDASVLVPIAKMWNTSQVNASMHGCMRMQCRVVQMQRRKEGRKVR